MRNHLKNLEQAFNEVFGNTSYIALASGALGIGCAACGSFILTTMLSSFGAASALAILPLRGGEFGILSVALLLVSLFLISKKIAAPLICNPPQKL